MAVYSGKPFKRGDDAVWDMVVPNLAGDGVFDLRGCHVFVTAKFGRDAFDQPDSEAAWQHSIVIDSSGNVTSSDGLTLGTDGAAAGALVEHLTAAESTLLAPGSYRIDVQVTDASGIVTTVVSGSEKVEGDITRTP